MSSASSNQSFVRDGAGYDEVYPSGHENLDSPREDRSSLANSPSLTDEGLETRRPEDDFTQDLDDTEPPIQSVVGPEGLRKFIMLPIWTVNTLFPQLKNPILKPLGTSMKSLTTYLSVYLTNRKNVTMMVLKVLGFMSKC